MNLVRNHVRDGCIDQLVPPDPVKPYEQRGLDLDREVPGSVPGTGVAGMQGAVIPHVHGRRIERRLQASADTCHTLGGQGSTCMNGRTSCDWNTPFVT